MSSISFAVTKIKSDTQALKIILKNEDVEIEIPRAAREALNAWNPEFNVFGRDDYSPSVLKMFKDRAENRVPMAFISDLEKDGQNDIVLIGQDTKTQYVVALLQRKGQWKAVQVTSWSEPNVKKSKIPTADGETSEVGVPFYILEAHGDNAKKLKNKTGIQIESYLGPAEIFEIKNNKALKFKF